VKRALLLLWTLLPTVAHAHELQSVALWLDEAAPGAIVMTMKSPVGQGGIPTSIVPRLAADCVSVGEMRATREGNVVVREWHQSCASALDGMPVRIDGLDPRVPEAAIVARFADGLESTIAVDYHDPRTVLNRGAGGRGTAQVGAYLTIGIEHILLGFDHLLFVSGLLLIVLAAGHGGRMLVAAVTAFTVAHSITLSFAVLGIWGLPPRVVEVLIALSILVLAVELAAHSRRMAPGLPPTLTLARPWAAAFLFGLLHGFGFAGALADIGLPAQARGWALLLFNLGVEIGQLIFVGVVVATWLLGRRFWRAPLSPFVQGATTTALGGIAAYWALDRALVWGSGI
jgi:hypothetical protein